MSQEISTEEVNQLVSEAQQQDAAAFARLYDLFVRHIFRFVMMIVRDHQAAQDVTSETFVKVWRCLGRYKAQNFKAYLFTVARNAAYDHLRREKHTVTSDYLDLVASTGKSVQEALEESEEEKAVQQKVWKALEVLKENYREVIVLRFMGELSVRETAKVMNKSEEAVRVLQHRALAKVKELLSHHE